MLFCISCLCCIPKPSPPHRLFLRWEHSIFQTPKVPRPVNSIIIIYARICRNVLAMLVDSAIGA